VTSIGVCAFDGCGSLESISVEGGNTMYDSRDNCNAIIVTETNTLFIGIKNTVIPNSVTSIGQSAFSNCSGLTSVNIPNSVTTIGDNAFSGCSGLTSVAIPNSVTSIWQSAFSGCSALETIIVEEGNSKYDSRENCNAIIETSTNTLYIGCKGSKIPSTVAIIGDHAFGGCRSIKSIIIPSSVTRINSGAFTGCWLENIVVKNINTIINSDAFSSSTYKHAVLYVPMGERWNAIYGRWGDFINIREIAAETRELTTKKAFTLMNANSFGFMVYDPLNNKFSIVNSFYDVDESSANSSWQLVTKDGSNYLYNIGAKQYASINPDGNIVISDTPLHVNMNDGENGILMGDNNQSQWNFVLNEKVNIDQQFDSIDPISDFTSDAPGKYFNLNGQSIIQPGNGIVIQRSANGKSRKIIVK